MIGPVAIPRRRWNNWNNLKLYTAKEKETPVMEEGERVKRESDGKEDSTDGRSLNGDCGVASRLVPVLICAPTGPRGAQHLPFFFVYLEPLLT